MCIRDRTDSGQLVTHAAGGTVFPPRALGLSDPAGASVYRYSRRDFESAGAIGGADHRRSFWFLLGTNHVRGTSSFRHAPDRGAASGALPRGVEKLGQTPA